MAIQYKNQTFDLTGTIATTVLTMDVSSRAILQNIQTENVSTATTTVVVSMYDQSGSATTPLRYCSNDQQYHAKFSERPYCS